MSPTPRGLRRVLLMSLLVLPLLLCAALCSAIPPPVNGNFPGPPHDPYGLPSGLTNGPHLGTAGDAGHVPLAPLPSSALGPFSGSKRVGLAPAHSLRWWAHLLNLLHYGRAVPGEAAMYQAGALH